MSEQYLVREINKLAKMIDSNDQKFIRADVLRKALVEAARQYPQDRGINAADRMLKKMLDNDSDKLLFSEDVDSLYRNICSTDSKSVLVAALEPFMSRAAESEESLVTSDYERQFGNIDTRYLHSTVDSASIDEISREAQDALVGSLRANTNLVDPQVSFVKFEGKEGESEGNYLFAVADSFLKKAVIVPVIVQNGMIQPPTTLKVGKSLVPFTKLADVIRRVGTKIVEGNFLESVFDEPTIAEAADEQEEFEKSSEIEALDLAAALESNQEAVLDVTQKAGEVLLESLKATKLVDPQISLKSVKLDRADTHEGVYLFNVKAQAGVGRRNVVVPIRVTAKKVHEPTSFIKSSKVYDFHEIDAAEKPLVNLDVLDRSDYSFAELREIAVKAILEDRPNLATEALKAVSARYGLRAMQTLKSDIRNFTERLTTGASESDLRKEANEVIRAGNPFDGEISTSEILLT